MKYRYIELESRSKEAPLSDKVLNELERKLNIRFPSQYRLFLKKTNGGKPDKYIALTTQFRELHKTAGGKGDGYGSDYPIESFLCIGSDYYEISNEFSMFKSRIPFHMLPIAAVDGGGLILISLKNDNKGKVYAWFQEGESEIENANSFENVFLIEDSFDDFLDSLLNYNQFISRYFDENQLREARDSWLQYLKFFEDENNLSSMSSHYLDGAFLDVMLSQFESSKENLVKGIKLHNELGYELPSDTDWEKWNDFIEIAIVEEKEYPQAWKSRFADRISFIEITNR